MNYWWGSNALRMTMSDLCRSEGIKSPWLTSLIHTHAVWIWWQKCIMKSRSMGDAFRAVPTFIVKDLGWFYYWFTSQVVFLFLSQNWDVFSCNPFMLLREQKLQLPLYVLFHNRKKYIELQVVNRILRKKQQQLDDVNLEFRGGGGDCERYT